MNYLRENFDGVTVTEDIVQDINNIMHVAQNSAYRQVNALMSQTYWYIGKRIVMQEQRGRVRSEYGTKTLTTLAKELSTLNGKSVSPAQLRNCRQFYMTFPDEKICYTLCSKLNWSQLRLIMRLTSEEERNFYIEQCQDGALSVRELERNIKSDMYHRTVKQQLPVDMQKEAPVQTAYVKDPYILEFLGMKTDEKYEEGELESLLISHIQKFLLELGKGFSFVDRQLHIASESNDFFIDLVFYNYFLKCFVIVDLKMGKLEHRDIGQMDMYVRMFDDLKRIPGDNPTIGIILCNDKDETVVKYSLLNDSNQIFAAKYKTYMPSPKELEEELTRNRNFYLDK